MGLIGIILASLVNWWMKSSMLDFVISAVGVLIFTGLVAYDTQRLKRIAEGVEYGAVSPTKLAPWRDFFVLGLLESVLVPLASVGTSRLSCSTCMKKARPDGRPFLWLGGLYRPLLHHKSLGPTGALCRGQRHEVRPRGQFCGVQKDPLQAGFSVPSCRSEVCWPKALCKVI